MEIEDIMGVTDDNNPPTRPDKRPLGLFPMRKAHRPELWQFICLMVKREFLDLPSHTLATKHAESAYCLRCKCAIYFRLGNHKVAEHMKAFHAQELKAFYDRRIDHADSKKPVNRWLTKEFDQCVDQHGERRDITDEQQKRVNRLVAIWIAKWLRPLSIVEDDELRHIIDYIGELGRINVKLPTRTPTRNEIVTFANELRTDIKAVIQSECKFYSITSDIWTDRSLRSYISLTLHYLTSNFESKSWTLEATPFPGKHDGPGIKRVLESTLDRWGLEKENCTKLLRDGAANAVAAANALGISHMSCVAHTIHLVVGAALLKRKRRRKADIIGVSITSQVTVATMDEQGVDNGGGGVVENVVPDVIVVARADDDQKADENDGLTEDERLALEALREAAVEEGDAFAASCLSPSERDPLDRIRDTVQVFREVAVYFRRSSKAHHRLAEIQSNLRGISIHKVVGLIVDCPTRWNSTWDMLQRCIELEGALKQFFYFVDETTAGKSDFKGADKFKRPDIDDWLRAKCLRTLLTPFAVGTETLSGQKYPTLAIVLPYLRAIKTTLQRDNLFDRDASMVGNAAYVAPVIALMQDVRTALLELFLARFTSMDEDLLWITYLDPRLARMKHAPVDEHEQPMEWLQRALLQCTQDDPDFADTEDPSMLSPIPLPLRAGEELHNLVFGQEESDCATSVKPTAEDACRREIAQYLHRSSIVGRRVDPFEWWRCHRDQFPRLSRLARKWLGTVATSVPSEHVFSTGGNVVTIKRCSLTPDLVRDIVFTAENYDGARNL
ncbi:hypothetical protein FI667_g6579, partial [Globisporangium splendens]